MYNAKYLYSKIKGNYDNLTNNLENYLQDSYNVEKKIPQSCVDYNRDSENVNSEYHDWLKQNPEKDNRELIINTLELKSNLDNNSTNNLDNNSTNNLDNGLTNGLTNNLDNNLTNGLTNNLDNSNICTRDELFNWLTNRLHWADLDEKKMTPRIINITPLNNLIQYFNTMMIIANDIEQIIRLTYDMDDTTKYNFLFHVISKGELFVRAVETDYMFCVYLLEQYQPLYTYMMDVLRLNGYHIPS